jgi:methyltransferase family protein
MRFNPLDYPICLAYPKRIAPSTWWSHVPFAMFLVDAMRPETFVELGTYYGVSYCAFCQAVHSLDLDTKCFAIDTWRGDHQGGSYGDQVLADLRRYHDPLYGKFSRLIESTFDNALPSFEKDAIDLLHVDGCHTYDTVKSDFENWLPKMSPRGVMLFHDTNIREPSFGVWKLWEELKPQYPHFEFFHGYGLGLLAIGQQHPEIFQIFSDSSEQDLTEIRRFFEQVGVLREIQASQYQTITSQRRRIEELEDFLAKVRRNPIFRAYHSIKYMGQK